MRGRHLLRTVTNRVSERELTKNPGNNVEIAAAYTLETQARRDTK
jgi:hypothetical protein